MAASPSSESKCDNDSSWSLSKWWNSSCNEGCMKAEMGLIKQFVDDDIYLYESKQVPIDYDAEPLSVKQKKLQRSQSYSFFSFMDSDNNNNNKNNKSHQYSKSVATMSTSSIPKYQKNKDKDKPNKKKRRNSKINTSNRNNTSLNQEFIHTLTFRIKQDKLETFYKMNDNDNDNDNDDDNSDSDEEFYHPPEENKLNEDEIKNDGQAIEGKSMSRFFQRTVSQEGSSTFLTLQREIDVYSKNKLCKQKSIVPIVLAHGYGCAGGIFIPSITTIYQTLLSQIKVCESPIIHIIDWLGNGQSSRPEFQCETTSEAEDWFVESLEAWRISMNIDRMILCAHSLGGYASCIYAMKYPMHIEHLIAVSPVGVPIRPKDSTEEALKNYSWRVRTMFKTFAKLWNSGWTPHDVIRMSGPKGKSIIEKIVQKRLFRLSDDNPLKSLLAEYLYHVIAQQGSGEYALNKILAPGAWAHNPLAQRIGKLKQFQKNVKGYGDFSDNDDQTIIIGDNDDESLTSRDSIGLEPVESKNNDDNSESDDDNIDVNNVLNSNLKIDFIYGETDWMTSAHAVKLKQSKVIKCQVYINPDCGHQLILENAQGFGRLLGGCVAKGQILSYQ